MDKDIPNFNPIVVSRMQQKKLELHQQRLQNIKVFFLTIKALHPSFLYLIQTKLFYKILSLELTLYNKKI